MERKMLTAEQRYHQARRKALIMTHRAVRKMGFSDLSCETVFN